MAPIKLSSEKTSFHVLESLDAAARIVEFANDNDAAMIITGQATYSAASNLRPWRSNMTKIVEEAQCIVHVVKLAQ
jgi:nucleotide-binding universal stress UspA family protein